MQHSRIMKFLTTKKLRIYFTIMHHKIIMITLTTEKVSIICSLFSIYCNSNLCNETKNIGKNSKLVHN